MPAIVGKQAKGHILQLQEYESIFSIVKAVEYRQGWARKDSHQGQYYCHQLRGKTPFAGSFQHLKAKCEMSA